MNKEDLKIAVWDQWYIFEKIWQIDVTAREFVLLCTFAVYGKDILCFI